MPESQWYLQRGPEQFGPFGWNEIVELSRQGRIEPTDLLWRTGDQTSRAASSVPGLMDVAPVAAARSSAAPWVAAAIVVAVVALVVALILISSSGDDDDGDAAPASTDADTTLVETTTAADATTTTVAETTTTAAETTSTTAAETTTTSATTAAPPTTLPVATADDLVGALPDPNALPSGWSSDGDPPDTEMFPNSGPGYGVCGLANEDMRAQDNNVNAVAHTTALIAPDDGELHIGLLAFSNEEDATAFMAQTVLQASSCPGSIVYQVVEGPDDDQADVFTGPVGDNEAVWDISETFTPGTTDPSGADERFVYEYTGDWSTTFEGTDYAFQNREWDMYERHGNIVLFGSLYGVSGPTGFDPFDAPIYIPTLEGLLAGMDLYRPDILDNLRAGGFIT